MRITFQPSSGRGEFELSEPATNGLTPSDLVDYFITLKLGDLSFYTSIKVTHEQNKYRLRRRDGNASENPTSGTRYPQIQNQVSHILLLPQSVREEGKTGFGLPVLMNNSYIIKHITLENVNIVGSDRFVADAVSIECVNQGNSLEQVSVRQRIEQITRIWQNLDRFPSNISSLLAQHQRVVRSGNPIPETLAKLVRDLQSAVEVYSEEVNIPYSKRTYVVPALVAMLDDVVEEQPVALEQIEQEHVEIRRREVKKWRVWASRRGSSSVKFRKEVQKAYNYRCVVCGARFPPTAINKNPGIDAAHIIPWSIADLDEVYNGLGLCKLHHWAFDEGLLRVVHREDVYYVEVDPEAVSILGGTDFSLDHLQAVAGPIPENRLPHNRSYRPRPDLLDRLQRDTSPTPI
jgi:hypothetical protein